MGSNNRLRMRLRVSARNADLSVDDYFTILISPNHGGRNGYEFSVNPLGTLQGLVPLR